MDPTWQPGTCPAGAEIEVAVVHSTRAARRSRRLTELILALYVDTSALLKRYVEEPNSSLCERHLLADRTWITGRHTLVETRRNLSRLLEGEPLALAREQFAADWLRLNVIELDELTCEISADIAEATGARTLDALHLGAASRVGKGSLAFLTFDVRQAQAARTLGFQVLGA